jgi:hypothetical protein
MTRSITRRFRRGIAIGAIGLGSLGLAGGLAASSAGPAAAATAAAVKPAFPIPGPWEFTGSNTIDLTYGGSTFTYKTWTTEDAEGVITGWLYDKYLPGFLMIHGIVTGRVVLFEVTYPGADPQGTRAFDGTISWGGHVSGVWTETGSEAGSGTFTLVKPLHH